MVMQRSGGRERERGRGKGRGSQPGARVIVLGGASGNSVKFIEKPKSVDVGFYKNEIYFLTPVPGNEVGINLFMRFLGLQFNRLESWPLVEVLNKLGEQPYARMNVEFSHLFKINSYSDKDFSYILMLIENLFNKISKNYGLCEVFLDGFFSLINQTGQLENIIFPKNLFSNTIFLMRLRAYLQSPVSSNPKNHENLKNFLLLRSSMYNFNSDTIHNIMYSEHCNPEIQFQLVLIFNKMLRLLNHMRSDLAGLIEELSMRQDEQFLFIQGLERREQELVAKNEELQTRIENLEQKVADHDDQYAKQQALMQRLVLAIEAMKRDMYNLTPKQGMFGGIVKRQNYLTDVSPFLGPESGRACDTLFTSRSGQVAAGSYFITDGTAGSGLDSEWFHISRSTAP